MEATFDSTKPRKTKHSFRQRGIYLVEVSEKKACYIYYTDLAEKKLNRCNKSKAKITATQKSFQRGKGCIEVSSFVLALRAKAPRILWKKKSIKSRFAPIDFFTKKLSILSPFEFFFIFFFSTDI